MRSALFHFISQITQFFKTAFEKPRDLLANKRLFIIDLQGNKKNLTLKDYFFTIDF
jgi:hypothetical protein